MSNTPNTPDKAQPEFHKCCGQCPEARKATADGSEMEAHEPCKPPQRAADEPKPGPVLK